ncbi:polysaccharide deacetylase family protein [Pseudogracilibacillus auburnensis]|uniref:polysaccharide deacetylase family protein n=1 Tax=Pseudogracilibacillus auburnensis TaxID=1494959 RepID=UPI001A9649BC|nr:polysaccharide deacetylase family protein [Pseudogracilibacillus auburnensis]MBO1004355.1 polysaccharide deacetylase family protein [Pseudogracilibacillus auburnensis]
MVKMIKGVKRIKWPGWVVIFLLFLGLTFMIGKTAQAIQNITHKEAISVKINSEQIDTGIKLQSETKEADSFTSFVTYPYTEIEAIDLPVRKWVLEQEKLFHEEIEQIEMMFGENIEAHFNLQTEIKKINDDLFSILMTVEQHVNEENEYSLLQTFTIDLQAEKIVELNDIMNKAEEIGNELFLLFKDNIPEKSTFDEDSLRDKLQNIQHINWVIDNDNINFYFNPNEIGNKKIIEINIPLIKLHKYLTDEMTSILISDEMAQEIKRESSDESDKLKTNGKYIALTFDDGPDEEVTPRILETLREYNAKATFYMLSQKATNNPELAKQVADEGHEIGNHSITHANLNTVGASRIHSEVVGSMEQIEKATGVKPTTFRPPYGEFNQTVINQAADSNQSIIMWSVDTLDWKHRNANSVFENMKLARSGSIVLMHDIHATTADALPQIMEYLTEQGFEFVTVSELLPLIDGEGAGPYYGN